MPRKNRPLLVASARVRRGQRRPGLAWRR
jgi:hypothetical protein